MNVKEKAGYIAYYYKWHIITGTIVILFFASFLYNHLTRKDNIFFLEVINSNVPLDGSGDLIERYGPYADDYDPSKQQMTGDYCYIDTNGGDYMSVATDQKVAAMLTVGSIDAMITTPEIMEKYKGTECFADLSEILPKDLQETLKREGCEFYYTKITDVNTNKITEVPVGVIISNTPVIKSGFIDNNGIDQKYFGPAPEAIPVYAVMYNSAHIDRAVGFLRFLSETR